VEEVPRVLGVVVVEDLLEVFRGLGREGLPVNVARDVPGALRERDE
jgi:hypothetical protein